MADTMSRPSAAAPKPKQQAGPQQARQPAEAHEPKARPVALLGIAFAAWTIALGVAILICLTLTAWVTAAHHDDAIRPAIATALQAWLLAQHTAIGVGSGAISVVPLGLTVLLGALLVRGGRLTARHSGGHDLLDAGAATLSLALPYAVIAALLTNPAHNGAARPEPLQALAGAFVLALLCGGFGALRETGHLRRLTALVPDDVRLAMRAGFSSSAVVVGGGAVMVAAALATNADRAGQLTSATHGGYSGAVLLSVVSLAYVPNAAAWASAYALGPGFAVGTHTSVSVTGVTLGAVPSLPLLAPLPESGTAAGAGWLSLAVPIGAGIVGGWLLTRARPARTPADNAPWWDKHGVLECAWGLAAGLVAGVAVAVLAWLSGGSLGGGRMSVVGPAGGWVLLAGVLEIGVVAAATMWTLRWRDRRAEPSDAAR
jgi:hypothetical protein